MTRLVALALLAGCTDGDTATEGLLDGPMVDRTYQAATSDGQGLVTVPVSVDAATSRFMVTGWSSQNVNLEEIRGPSGEVLVYWGDWWEQDERLTQAIYPESVTAVNWPSRRVDGELEPGEYQVVLATTDRNWDYRPNTDLEVAVHRVSDPSLTSGKVDVRIVWAQGVDQSAHVVTSVQTAIERWREIWAQRGLTLAETYQTSTLADNLPWAYRGSAGVKSIAASGNGDALILVIGELFPDGPETLGVSGALPGSLEPTERKYVALSWLAHAGANALFDDEERRIMGETMAHEVGHYMGLYHPVEGDYATWDALADTDKCRSESACDASLGSNNMYPYPLCTWETCEPQAEVTGDQQGVLQRHVGAL